MKVTMNGMVFESDPNDATDAQERQLKIFLDSVERIEAQKTSNPLPMMPQFPLPQYPTLPSGPFY